MDVVQLLQRVGLNKYEAEAYAALLRDGPLTGYEVAKRSAVPLSRSYEVLERLHTRGLVLVQPGEPARYAAEDPSLLVGQVRREMTETLDQLDMILPAAAAADDVGFWVVRGRANILARARAMVEVKGAEGFLQIGGNEADAVAVASAARRQGLTVTAATSDRILLVVDGEALVGTLIPADRCQAVISRNPALVEVLAPDLIKSDMRQRESDEASADWLGWEREKQRRILRLDDRRKGA